MRSFQEAGAREDARIEKRLLRATKCFSVWTPFDANSPEDCEENRHVKVEKAEEEEEDEEEKKEDIEQPPSYLLPIDQASALFTTISSINNAQASQASRQERKLLGKEKVCHLTYGEVTFDSMYRILQKIQDVVLEEAVIEKGGNSNSLSHGVDMSSERGLFKNCEFVDLGSGAGCPVIAGACMFPFSRCVGIEILESLHMRALVSKAEYDAIDGSSTEKEAEAAGMLHHPLPVVEFLLGDIFDIDLYDWRRATVVLANSTCFTPDMFEKLGQLGQAMALGSVFITLTYELSSEFFTLVTTDRMDMSWGGADVYYHIRKDKSQLE